MLKNRIEIFYFIFLCILIIFFGLYIRFEDVKFWEAHKDDFFYKELPLYSEFDSFYFARIAEDIKREKFKRGKADPLRYFPDNSSEKIIIYYKGKKEKFRLGFKYSISGHLLSFLIYYLNKITSLPFEKITFYLIPILAVLFVIPLFLYTKDLGLPYAGLIGSLIGVSSPMYWGRSNLMRLDTDVLNLFFPIFIAYCFFKFFESKKISTKYLWIIISSLSLIFYQLWYAHPNLNFVLIFAFIIRFFWDKKFQFKKEDFIYLIILILPQIWYIYTGPLLLYKQIKTLVFNIKSPTASQLLFKDFPNIFMSISELQKLTYSQVIKNIVLNFYLGIAGLIGAILFFIFYLRKTIFLLPFFGIGLLSFVSGARFIMYLAPFIGLGLGFLVHLILNKIFPLLNLFKTSEKQRIVIHLLGSIFIIFLFIIQKPVLIYSAFPKVTNILVKDMKYLKENTPENAVIWTWWDYGYAFQLYSRRATFHDGGSQATPKTYFVARSFAITSPEEGWYITSFISNYGLKGIIESLLNGTSAKDLTKKIEKGDFAKKIKTPVYWVFTKDLISKFGWIYYFGSYNFDTKKGTFGKILFPRCRDNPYFKNIIDCEDIKARIDLNSGIIYPREGIPLKIKTFYKRDKKGLYKKEYFKNGDYVVEVVEIPGEKMNQVFLLPPQEAKSLFNQMFLLRKYDPKYFELVFDDFPEMVVYKVKSNFK